MDASSVSQKLSKVLQPTLLKLQNMNVSTLGQKTQILRIQSGKADGWGQTEDDLAKHLISDVIIKHPWASRVQLFMKANEAMQQAETSAIDMWEFLPILIKIPFFGDYDSTPIELLKGDLICQVLRDEHNTKIPILMQISRIMGAFSTNLLVGKEYEATLFRGKCNDNIQTIIDLYVNSLT